MKIESCERRYFKLKSATEHGPYIGFTLYQHFDGEKLYSDIVVRPENNMTETEKIESYPLPRDVEQNGRQEGYYPPCSVAYFRVLWKTFEPRQGEYNYELIENILRGARERGQTVMFRLMPHSTRAEDDVPDWLKKIVDCPARPAGKRVKDSPADPKFLQLFGKAIEKIGERFDNNVIFDTIDISLTGAWGEGSGWENYPESALKELLDVYTESFPNTQLLGQVAAPWLIEYGRKNRPVGWRGDGVGHPHHMCEYYPRALEKLGDYWKTAPVSFESYWWLKEWMRQGWDIDDIIERTLSWHISTFNAKSMPIPEQWKEKIIYWNSKMGYHFAVRGVRYPKLCAPGDGFDLIMFMQNRGVAPIYRNIQLSVRLKKGNEEYLFNANLDIRKWLPGDFEESIYIKLPNTLSEGEYKLQIGIFDDTTFVPLETDTEKDGKYYMLTTISVKHSG